MNFLQGTFDVMFDIT